VRAFLRSYVCSGILNVVLARDEATEDTTTEYRAVEFVTDVCNTATKFAMQSELTWMMIGFASFQSKINMG